MCRGLLASLFLRMGCRNSVSDGTHFELRTDLHHPRRQGKLEGATGDGGGELAQPELRVEAESARPNLS